MEEFLKFFLPFAVIAGLTCWIVRGWQRKLRNSMAKDHPDQVYAAFTKQFDLELSADQIQSALASANVRRDISTTIEIRDFEGRHAGATDAYDEAISSQELLALRGTIGGLGEGVSICLLVDQSGSMANRMVALAGQIKAVSQVCGAIGTKLAIYGFTTVGWQGGQARKAWVKAGSPAYPGRLCTLMHIVYQDFDQPLTDANWQAMLEPNIFFENIDGEAIEWASSRLGSQSSNIKLLIVVSDGAPVDDATLLANGPEILVRHLEKVIRETKRNQPIRLGTIGIGHDVDQYYPCSTHAERPEQFMACLATLVAELNADSC
jgi:cobaltochelatase CobT